MPNTTVFSPVTGAVVPLEQVPDPVFSEHMLGDGLAIDPATDVICAPFDGKIIHFNKESHALVVGRDGLEMLIHVGLETVALKGEGFTPLAQTGDEIVKGQPLLKFNPIVLSQKAACPFVILVVTTPTDALLVHKAEGIIKTGEVLFELAPIHAQPSDPQQNAYTQSLCVTVINPNGLHARPAGVLAKMALEYPFAVEIIKANSRANAKSVIAVMGLALAYKDQITLRAGGPADQAARFLSRLETGFKNGFGEISADPGIPAAAMPKSPTAMTACSGLAHGQSFLYQPSEILFEEHGAAVPTEQKRLDDAVQAIILETESKIAASPQEATRTILNAHLSILRDPQLLQTARKAVDQGYSAASGIYQAIQASMAVLQQTGSVFFMERTADLKDLRRRLLLHLGGREVPLPPLPQDCILIAQDLLPSEVTALEGRAAGVLLAEGSPTAHASILLRNMGIPSVVGAGRQVLDIPNATPLWLDADQAAYLLNPTPQQQASFADRLEQLRRKTHSQQQTAREPAATTDGVHISVTGNTANAKESAAAIQNGADGLGLVRTEFLFDGRQQPPSQAEQQAAYQPILDAAGGKPVTLRTLDAGGDKPLPFITIPAEENPIVGIRGIRAFEQNETFFRTQLRALLSTRHTGNLRIMLPMVTFAEEVDFFKQLITQEQRALGSTDSVQIGIMVEVPSAALISAQLAARVDFLSIGTNDLTQYTLAIDRGHKTLSARADSLHPAVLKLISLTCQGAKTHAKPVAVCGAMAGDLAAIPFLIGLGVTELAVGAAAIAPIKALIRQLNHQQCVQTAQEALQLSSAAEVRALAKKVFGI